MADQDEKFPPRPPHRPCGPWPSVFPYDKDYPGDHPKRPPQVVPGNVWCNDTEPVMAVYPWESCCDSGDRDQCLCITSGEVEIWNDTYSVVSANSAAWSEQAPDNSWRDSADNWQSSYDTVSAESGTWNEAYSIASAWDSASVEALTRIVSATSSFLITYSAEPYIHVNREYLAGEGSEELPLDLSDRLKDFYSDVDDAMNALYQYGKWGEDEYRNWLDKGDLDDLYDHLAKIDKLMWDVKPGVTSGERTPDGIFHQLENIWAILTSPSGNVYKEGQWISIVDRTISVSGMQPELWYDTTNTVSENSAKWSNGYTAYEVLSENSGNWNSGYNAYLTLSENSGRYEEAYSSMEELSDASGNWNSTYDTVSENSASWNSGAKLNWEFSPDMNIGNVAEYSASNTIYFNYYEPKV